MFAHRLLTAVLVDSQLGGFPNATENRRNEIENSGWLGSVFKNRNRTDFQFYAHP